MKTKVKKMPDSRIELTVTLDAGDLAVARKKAVEKLSKEIRVEGFRKGKIPAEVAEKFIPENDLNAETIDLAVRTTVVEAFSKESQTPLAMPNVNVTKYVPGEMAEYVAVAEILPEIKLCDYKKLGVKKEAVKVSDEEIQGVLKNITESFAEKKVVKRAAKDSDEVVIDFVGKKDGKAFDGGSAKDYKLTLGSGAFIPGFEEGIVGREVGDKFDLNLTFPKDYGAKELAGAKTVFEVLLKQVNEVVKPELNDELAKKCGPFKSLDELKKDIEKNLAAQKEHQALQKFRDDLVETLAKKSKIAVPKIMLEDQMRSIRDDVANNAAAKGIDFDQLLEMSGMTQESWEKDAREVAELRIKGSLALQAIAVEQKITVSDEEVAAKIAELRDVYRNSKEAIKSLKDPNVKMDIKNRLTVEKAMDYLVKVNS